MKQFGLILLTLAAALVVVAAVPYPVANQEEEEVDLKDAAQLQSVLESLMTAQGLDDNMEEDEADQAENQLQEDESDEAEAQLFNRLLRRRNLRKYLLKLMKQHYNRRFVAKPKFQDTEVQAVDRNQDMDDEAEAQFWRHAYNAYKTYQKYRGFFG